MLPLFQNYALTCTRESCVGNAVDQAAPRMGADLQVEVGDRHLCSITRARAMPMLATGPSCRSWVSDIQVLPLSFDALASALRPELSGAKPHPDVYVLV